MAFFGTTMHNCDIVLSCENGRDSCQWPSRVVPITGAYLTFVAETNFALQYVDAPGIPQLHNTDELYLSRTVAMDQLLLLGQI